MRGRYKKWALPFLSAHQELALSKIEPNDPFFVSPLFLEIGAGKGDFALALLKDNPSVHLLALERDVSIAGTFAKKAVEQETTSLRIYPGDFDEVFPSLQNCKFDRIYLNFSDPWPKKRHEKRRLTTLGRLKEMLSLLVDGGEIRIKTDNDGLYAFTLEQIELGKLSVIENQENYAVRASDDYESEYERNFRSIGKSIHRIIIKKEN